MDTIYALATARGKSGVSVVRVSGSRAFEAGRLLAGGLPEARRAGVRILRSSDGSVIDHALVLSFAEGESFTGESVVEFHLHGSMAIVRAILAELSGIPGLRGAEAGEFSRRALLNNRLDIAQVEGLGDLINAETETQRKQALRIFSGELGARVENWRKDLLRAKALLEATIDFADEEVPVDVHPEARELLKGVRVDLDAQIAGARAAERIRDGFEIAILGAPNIGKSTLLNCLAKRDAAITSDVAGTTRDIIEVRMDLHGLPVTFLDTAGLRAAEDSVEEIGIARTRERAALADLRIFLTGAAGEQLDMTPEPDDIMVAGKADLAQSKEGVSGLTGLGVPGLLERVASVLENRAAGAGIAVAERHRAAMAAAAAAIGNAEAELDYGEDRVDLAAGRLNEAIAALESLVGRIDAEQVLDEVFARFCIGK